MSKFIRNQWESSKQYIIVGTGNDDIIMPMSTVVGCYAIAGLVPPHSLKLGLTNLKTEAR
jgi:hypothetical protein